MRIGVLFVIFLLLTFCSSDSKSGASSGLLYERSPIDKESAQAQAGQVVYSKAQVGLGAGRAKVVYSHFIFQGATKTELLFSYEEHYDRLKEKADLKEPKAIAYNNGEARLDDMKLILYRVTPSSIEYKLETTK